MSNQNPVPDLPETYYRDNFHCLVSTVAEQYSDLLTVQETHWYNTYLALSEPAQCLYVRLLTRRGPLFRRDKIHYSEIKALPNAFDELDKAKLVTLQPADITHHDFCNLFTKPELINTFDFLSDFKQAKKAEVVEQVILHQPDLAPYSCELLKVHHNEHLAVFFLLFFGNTHQDLSQFVLTDIGIHQFEDYPIDSAYRLFQRREHIDEWLSLSQQADTYWQYKEAKDLSAIATMQSDLPSAFDWRPLERKRQRLINHIARDLERIGLHDAHSLEQALTLFQQSDREPSRERQIRILDKQGNSKRALALAQQILEAPQNEEEADVAATLCHRLLNKLGDKQPPRRKPSFASEKLQLAQQQSCVELDVAAHYQQLGWQSYYVENTLLCGLFGLVMWDIIFSAQQGAFLNPFQRSPKDMFSRDFYLTRKQLVDQRLLELENGDWKNWLTVYTSKKGISNDWVHWGLITEEIIEKAVSTIPVKALTAIFKRILFDPKNNRSGFPDLVLFKDGEYCLAEVKGPGDTLQSNQIRWLKMFKQHAITAKVVYVEWL